MDQEYQNESAPIFYYGKSPKTNRKHLKISYLQALALGRLIKMTLYQYSSLFVFRWVSKQEYDEGGRSQVDRKCP